MDCLLISGYSNTGKTTILARLANFLLANSYVHIAGDLIPPPGTAGDFRAVLQSGVSNRTVLLNTKSDYVGQAAELETIYNTHAPIDALITSIRDAGLERTAFLDALRTMSPVTQLEIPLAKISGNRSDSRAALPAYWDRIEELCRFILVRRPFSL